MQFQQGQRKAMARILQSHSPLYSVAQADRATTEAEPDPAADEISAFIKEQSQKKFFRRPQMDYFKSKPYFGNVSYETSVQEVENEDADSLN
jgi:hypothetical protein